MTELILYLGGAAHDLFAAFFAFIQRQGRCARLRFLLACHRLRAGILRLTGSSAGRKKTLIFALECLPLIAVSIAVPAFFGTRMPGYKLTVNGTYICTLTDEGVYDEAVREAVDRICLHSGGSDLLTFMSGEPVFTPGVFRLDSFSGARAAADALISACGTRQSLGCSVYIDGEFFAAADNEQDARAALGAPLRTTYTDEDETQTAYIQDIEYREELFPADYGYFYSYETMLRQTKQAVADGRLTIGVIKTVVHAEPLACETIEGTDSSLDSGSQEVLSEGSDGIVQVTELVKYASGKAVTRTEVSRLTIKEATARKVLYGTKMTASASAETSGGYTVKVVTGSASYVTEQAGGFIWPAVGCNRVNSDYGYRWGSFHGGIDLGSSSGSSAGKPIVAAAAGTVTYAGWYSTYGYCVIVDHGGGLVTLYGHCMEGSLAVSAGEEVSAGQRLASIGMTGNATGYHLHFEVRINGTRVDPKPYLGLS